MPNEDSKEEWRKFFIKRAYTFCEAFKSGKSLYIKNSESADQWDQFVEILDSALKLRQRAMYDRFRSDVSSELNETTYRAAYNFSQKLKLIPYKAQVHNQGNGIKELTGLEALKEWHKDYNWKYGQGRQEYEKYKVEFKEFFESSANDFCGKYYYKNHLELTAVYNVSEWDEFVKTLDLALNYMRKTNFIKQELSKAVHDQNNEQVNLLVKELYKYDYIAPYRKSRTLLEKLDINTRFGIHEGMASIYAWTLEYDQALKKQEFENFFQHKATNFCKAYFQESELINVHYNKSEWDEFVKKLDHSLKERGAVIQSDQEFSTSSETLEDFNKRMEKHDYVKPYKESKLLLQKLEIETPNGKFEGISALREWQKQYEKLGYKLNKTEFTRRKVEDREFGM